MVIRILDEVIRCMGFSLGDRWGAVAQHTNLKRPLGAACLPPPSQCTCIQLH